MEVGHSKARVVAVLRIDSAVPIKEQIVRPETVVVRTFRSGSDGKRHLRKQSGLEYALGSDKRYTLILKYKSLSEQ
jgi:hypothetical protein